MPRPDAVYGVDAPPPVDQGLDLRQDGPAPDAGVDASPDLDSDAGADAQR